MAHQGTAILLGVQRQQHWKINFSMWCLVWGAGLRAKWAAAAAAAASQPQGFGASLAVSVLLVLFWLASSACSELCRGLTQQSVQVEVYDKVFCVNVPSVTSGVDWGGSLGAFLGWHWQ
jgi:hypothetical protein